MVQIKITNLFFLITIFILSGCGTIKAYLAHMTMEFETLATNQQIYFESGTKDIAIKISELLPAAISHVEKTHYSQFKYPVSIYIFKSQNNFATFSNTSIHARGTAIERSLTLSPKIAMTGSYWEFLTHELSHVYLMQHLGIWNYTRKLPAWFQEGVATFTSRGGGSGPVSVSEAGNIY